MSDSLPPHELQHARLPCPSLSPGVCSNSCSLSQSCHHPTISSFVAPFSSCPQAFLSSGSFFSESALHIRWTEYWSFSFSISPSNEYSGLISFRIDWFDLLAVQGILKSLFQHHNWKASILQGSAFFTVHFSHPYMTAGKYLSIYSLQSIFHLSRELGGATCSFHFTGENTEAQRSAVTSAKSPSLSAQQSQSEAWLPDSQSAAWPTRLPGLTTRARSPLESHTHSCRLDLCLSGCDSHCLQCQGPRECTRCEEPFLLLEAQCVQECGKAFFADHANHKCTGELETVLHSLKEVRAARKSSVLILR